MKYSLEKLFVTIILSIFFGEFITMISIRSSHGTFNPLVIAALDSTLLTCIVFPFLYYFHHRPLKESFHQISQIKETLRENEEKFRQIYNNSPLGISLISQDWKYLDVNPEMEKIVGYSKEELIGKTPELITHPDFVDKNVRAFDELTSGKRPCYSFEKKYVRKDGEEIWCKLSVSGYHPNDNKNMPVVIAMMENITTRKLFEKNLKTSQAMLSEAEKLADMGHWQWDRASDAEVWSDQMFVIMGLKPSDTAPGKNEVRSAYSEKEWEKIVTSRERVFESGKSETAEVTVHDSGVGKAHLLLNIRPETDSAGKVNGLFGTCQDITTIKRTEERLKQAKEDAEDATKLKDKFVSLVAHDLQSPTTSNTNLIQLLLQDKNTPIREEHGEILQTVLRSSQKMNMLVKDVLNIARLKTGSLQLKKKYVNTHEMVEHVLADLMVRANNKGVNFINNIPKESMIFADDPLLRQVLENILANALKFSFEGGEIELFRPEGDDDVSIAIRDQGTGIDKRTLKHIFSYELGGSVEGTWGEVGTGLGLPLSNDIVSAHGGTLDIKTEHGKGSIFYIKIPYLKPLILIVDDEKIFIEEQKIHMRNLEIEVLSASNGKEALDLLKTRRPQLIITDVKMPVMDGLEFLGKVRETPELSKIPVIVVTGFEGMDIRNKAFKKGADDFVAKPFEVDELIPRVKRFIG